jgi:hypothetical protein
MPKKMKGLGSKNAQLSVRVTPHIKEIIAQAARSEGVDVSEWLRNLIVDDLKRRGALPMVPTAPGLREGRRM